MSTKWLHNKGWIPVSRAGMTSQEHWNPGKRMMSCK
nr:WPE palindromic element domain-containing protein [Wolbachia endosymbiont (group A) of Anomoia purmunda]